MDKHQREVDAVVNLGLLVLRLIPGLLMAGHGGQKLFGWFGGHGIEGTAGWLESLGLRPGKAWAPLAGSSEFLSGTLTSLGLFHPIGPIMMMGPMAMAMTKAHWGKPIWVTQGGGELPLTDATIATALTLTGPGAISADRLLGIRVPWWVAGLALVATVAGIGLGHSDQLIPSAEPRETEHEAPTSAASSETVSSGI